MSSAAAIRAATAVACAPWPRYTLAQEGWASLAADDVALQALWADTAEVYALFVDGAGQPLLASTRVVEGGYPALSRQFAVAAAPERMVRDLWGHAAVGAADVRPWLDHGAWRSTHPLAARPGPALGSAEPAFRPVPGNLMQLAAGPVFGVPAEPVHLRAHLRGERVAAMEARLGYAHKGVLALMRAKSPRAAARFAARLSADATVAHSLAFARAAEAALGIEASPRATMLRGMMAEMERVATHLGDLATAWAERPRLAIALGVLRERTLRAAAAAFGHRMMMDCVVPGGVAADIAEPAALLAAAEAVAGGLPVLDGLGEGVGFVSPAVLAEYGPGGVCGRAAAVAVDTRSAPGYPPYAAMSVPTLPGSDVAARLQLRLMEIRASLKMVQDWLRNLPPGPTGQALPALSGEGLAVAESPRGAVWHWLRLDGGQIAAAFAADPSWRLWPVQEAACLGARAADLSLIDRSFACARSGIDL